MLSPKLVSDSLCVETNFSASDFIKRLKTLLTMCEESYDSLKITYEKRLYTAAIDKPAADMPLTSTSETTFYSYLQDVAKLAERSCVAYVSNIRSAERYAAERNYTSCSLFSEDNEITLATASELYKDSDFIRYNEQQHNRFTAAINKLLESIGVDIPQKAVASLGSDNKETADSAETDSKLVAVLKQHYKYGFKYDSIRELMRFRQFADAMDIELTEDDEALKAAILACGTVIDDKVYCKSDDMPKELQKIIDEAFASGACVIYYESLFEKEQEWMESHVIISADMLKEYLQKNIAGCSYSKKFMVKGNRRSEKEAVTDELKRVWGDCPSNDVNDLSDRFVSKLPCLFDGSEWTIMGLERGGCCDYLCDCGDDKKFSRPIQVIMLGNRHDTESLDISENDIPLFYRPNETLLPSSHDGVAADELNSLLKSTAEILDGDIPHYLRGKVMVEANCDMRKLVIDNLIADGYIKLPSDMNRSAVGVYGFKASAD